MGQALYRKYRSKNLAEIVGQEPITRALDRAIKKGTVSHAYLFTGPRGVGKTSIARILAHEINGLTYDESLAAHLDIIEIDAASNRRIDEIRDLRDKVHVAPTSSKYKVYIIDEVHMLTKEAFNALLKTLEEPPSHVIFILATTEVHKLPETIVSRTQHFAFKPISVAQIADHLAYIAKQEKINIDNKALTLIAQHGRGSFRDSISLLDQVRNYGDKITESDVEAVLGVAPESQISDLISAIAGAQSSAVVEQLQALVGHGVNPTMISKQLGEILRRELLNGNGRLSSHSSIALQQKLLTISSSFDPFTALELVLLEFTVSDVAGNVAPSPQPDVAPAKKMEAQAVVHKVVKAEPVEKPTPVAPKVTNKRDNLASDQKDQPPEKTSETVEAIVISGDGALFGISQWPDVLTHIKQKYNTMYGVLRMAEASCTDNVLTLTFKFAFHQKRINDPKSKQIIIDAISLLGCSPLQIECVVLDPSTSAEKQDTTPVAEDLGTISNIFGGAELLES